MKILNNLLLLINLFYDSFKYAIRDITLFPSTNLLNVFYIALTIATASLFSSVLNLPTFLDWRGGFLGTGILGLSILISNKEDSNKWKCWN